MKHYEKLLGLGCFTFTEAMNITGGNTNTAKSMLKRYAEKGYVKQIKRNLYVAVSLETGTPVADPYRIASKITPTSYVSHRSAFAYRGYANQVSYELNVSSQSRFRDFEFDGMEYVCHESDISDGIVIDQGIRVTDPERTIVDYINDFDHIGGLEELLKGLEMIPFVSSEKILRYLSLYHKAILYQRTGYILEHFKETLKLDADFFEECQRKKGKSIRYFSDSLPREDMVYNSAWGLMAPKSLLSISGQEEMDDAD